jgi:hypothetical protein
MKKETIEWEIDDCKRYISELMNKRESGKITQEYCEEQKKKTVDDLKYYEGELKKVIKLVKTGREIAEKLPRFDIEEFNKRMKLMKIEEDKKYLILPEGLDKLEEMLKKKADVVNMNFEGISIDDISSVFARFKKEEVI